MSTVLFVPYECKDEVKSMGAKWDSTVSSWTIEKDNENYDVLTKKFTKNNMQLNRRKTIRYINVKYDDKELAKDLGCRFDKERKQWFVARNSPDFKLAVTVFV